ncbi:MAG: hypothetical protein LBG58_12525 [Planctomycetaceae bacterium]|jgi:hypothetical protein|nr:hypothetical protein [Planctomycetaceae bacterium]
MRYLILTLLLLPIVIGCSDKNPQGRVPICGEVTLDGKPLEHGEILFLSIAGSTPAVATGSSIKNGTFSLPAKQGIIPEQTYSVQFQSIEEISSTQKEPKEIKSLHELMNLSEIKTRNLIPPKYGIQSKETVTATKKSPNVFLFNLTSEPDQKIR